MPLRPSGSPIVGLFVMLAVLACGGAAIAAASGGRADSGAAVALQETAASPGSRYVWKDVDGNPLPFQDDAEIMEFMRHADIESVDDIELGVTNPQRVVLEKDGVKMRAALRDFDETYTRQRFDGVFYPRLRDSYTFDIAAYELSRLLRLDNIPPVTLRHLGASQVSLQVWLEGGLMESDRVADNLPPPSALAFRIQTQDMRVFDSVIGNVDRNSGNILYDESGKIWLIDHSRAFLRNDETRYLDRVSGCSRQLYERLWEITREELQPALESTLSDSEIDWVLQRRDKVLAHIDRLIAEMGEGAVLFEKGE